MKIHDVAFAGAIAGTGGAAPGELPQVAFSGRSNVGKSSLINRLLGRTRTKVARVSSEPGKTREINFYRVMAKTAEDEAGGASLEFFLVDLPGYGYARVPEHVRAAWAPLIESYLTDNALLRGVVHLVDARHDPTAEDRRMVDFLAGIGTPALFVLTKMDKLKRSQRDRRVADSVRMLGLDREQVLPFSSVSGEGREELLASLEALLLTPPARTP